MPEKLSTLTHHAHTIPPLLMGVFQPNERILKNSAILVAHSDFSGYIAIDTPELKRGRFPTPGRSNAISASLRRAFRGTVYHLSCRFASWRENFHGADVFPKNVSCRTLHGVSMFFLADIPVQHKEKFQRRGKFAVFRNFLEGIAAVELLS